MARLYYNNSDSSGSKSKEESGKTKQTPGKILSNSADKEQTKKSEDTPKLVKIEDKHEHEKVYTLG